MAQQNKTVTIAAIVGVIVVIGIGAYFLVAGGSDSPAPVVNTLPPEEPPPPPKEDDTSRATGRRGTAEETETKAETKTAGTDQPVAKEPPKKRGPTNAPRGVAP